MNKQEMFNSLKIGDYVLYDGVMCDVHIVYNVYAPSVFKPEIGLQYKPESNKNFLIDIYWDDIDVNLIENTYCNGGDVLVSELDLNNMQTSEPKGMYQKHNGKNNFREEILRKLDY